MPGLARREGKVSDDRIVVTGSLQNEVQRIASDLFQAGEIWPDTGDAHRGVPADRILSGEAAEQFALRLKRSHDAFIAAFGEPDRPKRRR